MYILLRQQKESFLESLITQPLMKNVKVFVWGLIIMSFIMIMPILFCAF